MNHEPEKRRTLTDDELDVLLRLVYESRTLTGAPRLAATQLGRPTQTGALALTTPTRWWTAVLATAAVLAVWMRPPAPHHSSPTQAGVSLIPVRMNYLPAVASSGHDRQDCVQSTPGESCSVLAVLRTFSSECQCLVWDLYRWDTGEIIRRTDAGERIEVVTSIEPAPSLDQVVVFAVAPSRTNLSNSKEAATLLECLIGSAEAGHPAPSPEETATVVSACLPSGVTVVPQVFASH